MYCIGNYREHLVIVRYFQGSYIADDWLTDCLLNETARLYAVFPEGLQIDQTRATNQFVVYHNDGRIDNLTWKENIPLFQNGDEPTPIPLTLVHQTTDPFLSELSYQQLRETNSINRLQQLAEAALQQSFILQKPSTVQKRIADLVIKDAIQQELSCPIAYTPFTLETAACVAPCYHIFEKDAITKWLETNTTCPECREQCSL
jgi:hypothetical protein